MFTQVTLSLLEGFMMTLKIFVLTLALALPLGLIISFGSMSKLKAVRWPIRTFIWIIRGTPLMLQLIVIYYGPGLMAAWAGQYADSAFFAALSRITVPDRFVAVITAFVINYACYFSEIYRGGILGVPKGQQEAGQVLGLSKSQIFFKITLLQMIKRIVPPISNEVITLVKDTSLSRIIALPELIWAGQAFLKGSQGISGQIWPLFFTCVYYLIFSGLLTVLFNKIEKKLGYFKI